MPLVYDTARTIKILGDDAQPLMQAINYAENPQSIDITLGKYSITAITGPNTETKRIESAESMMALAQAMPNIFGVGADLIVASLDWPDADKLAARLKNAIPPQILGPAEQTPESAQKMQGQNQAQQVQAQMVMQKAASDAQKVQSETALNFARANNYSAQAQSAGSKLQNETLRTASETASRELHDHLATIEVAHPVRGH